MVVLSKTKRSGVKKPFRLEEIWRIRTRLEIENNLMQLTLLNLAIDSKLRSSDFLGLRVCDISRKIGYLIVLSIFSEKQTLKFNLKSRQELNKV